MIHITRTIALNEAELAESFVRASGPGAADEQNPFATDDGGMAELEAVLETMYLMMAADGDVAADEPHLLVRGSARLGRAEVDVVDVTARPIGQQSDERRTITCVGGALLGID